MYRFTGHLIIQPLIHKNDKSVTGKSPTLKIVLRNVNIRKCNLIRGSQIF